MTDPLRKSITISCAVTHAFATFTERVDLWWPSSHRKFSTSSLTLDPTPGGLFIERAPTGETATFGEVLTCSAPHKITFTWNPGKITGPTEVTITFTAQGGSTLVEVEHLEGRADLGEEWETRVSLFSNGWTAVLAALQTQVKTRSPPCQ
ncbi:MAG: SRPBCC domain-containing protein [Boseongicola sp.]|nr:SRPBCC domain-containing protein [Boseongicola sp.]